MVSKNVSLSFTAIRITEMISLFKTQTYIMDDATMLMNQRKVKAPIKKHEYDKAYQKKIIEMTKLLMENPMEGPLQEAFDGYVSECIRHFKRLEIKPVDPPVLEYDKIMLPPKKIYVKSIIKQFKR